MVRTDTQRISVEGFLSGTIHSRITKRKKGEELEGVQPYRTFYLSLSKDDIRTKQLREGDRLTLGIIKVEKAVSSDTATVPASV